MVHRGKRVAESCYPTNLQSHPTWTFHEEALRHYADLEWGPKSKVLLRLHPASGYCLGTMGWPQLPPPKMKTASRSLIVEGTGSSIHMPSRSRTVLTHQRR